jgi:hypothetical protein
MAEQSSSRRKADVGFGDMIAGAIIMSDSEFTPQGTARVNSLRFDTELAAVWYAANYYYQASYNHGREYIGVVFRDPGAKPNEQYGITVRGDGGFRSSKVRVGDVPRGTIPQAVWHTHIPLRAGVHDPLALAVASLLDLVEDLELESFSTKDYNISDEASKVSVWRWGHRIPIYFVTATVIKRYRHPAVPEKMWHKEPPSQMQSRRHR